jgi:hypothetical protein
VTTENNRRFPRTHLRAEVKLAHPEVGEQRAHTRDISEGGAFVVSDGLTVPNLGDVIDVQVQGLPGEAAPVVPMRVVRIDKDGIGLAFIDREES